MTMNFKRLSPVRVVQNYKNQRSHRLKKLLKEVINIFAA